MYTILLFYLLPFYTLSFLIQYPFLVKDFVKLMNEELSSSADFTLPEYYFRVCRQEEGNSGKFFSQIERVKWEEM